MHVEFRMISSKSHGTRCIRAMGFLRLVLHSWGENAPGCFKLPFVKDQKCNMQKTLKRGNKEQSDLFRIPNTFHIRCNVLILFSLRSELWCIRVQGAIDVSVLWAGVGRTE